MDNRNNQFIISQMQNLSLHYCMDCNMNCTYCFINEQHKHATVINQNIRQALKDGTFVTNIKKLYNNMPLSVRENITSYSLWGAEPTINGDLFHCIHSDLLDFFPKINLIDFSTNGWCGGQKIYHDFVLPILSYAEDNKRDIIFDLQFSLDGPPEITDKTRRAHATEHVINTLLDLIQLIPDSNYFTFSIGLKTTWSMEIFKEYSDLSKLQYYYDWCDNVMRQIMLVKKGKSNIQYGHINFTPTLVSPSVATVEDGKMFANWWKLLAQIDTSKHVYYNEHYLCDIGLHELHLLHKLNDHNYDFFQEITGCSAGKYSWSLQYDGTITPCHQYSDYSLSDINTKDYQLFLRHSNFQKSNLKQFNSTYNTYLYQNWYPTRFNIFLGEVLALVACGQLDKKYATSFDDQVLLWLVSTMATCMVTEELITGNALVMAFDRIRLWGNGALDAIQEHYKWERQRGAQDGYIGKMFQS